MRAVGIIVIIVRGSDIVFVTWTFARSKVLLNVIPSC